uniref:Protein PLASTID MOVEMENT IMPAIRED 2 n=2 Tax=Anthurium amnicola TaxID=1678845 RepID=A0A1D1YHZ7_9ARAE
MVSEMANMESEAANGIGSVSAAGSLFGQRIHGVKHRREKALSPFLEESSTSNTREPHLANRDMGRFRDRKRLAEYEKAQRENELSNTRKTAKELQSRIEESNGRARAHKEDLHMLKKYRRDKGKRAMAAGGVDEAKYKELMQELEATKEELSKLKIDMGRTFEEKVKAVKETEASTLRAESYVNPVEELRKEIDNINEEHVLVEIARLDAVRETREIEAQREAEAVQFAKNMKKAKARIKEMTREVNQTQSLEQKLAATNADLNILQGEMGLVRAMVKNSNGNNSMNEEEKRRKEELESEELLRSAKAELEAAKKDLVSVKDEGFQLMASMDAVREELKNMSRETAQLRKVEVKQDLTIQNLNSKLLRAKSKLEAATVSEENARAIVINLMAALKQLQSEVDSANKEKDLIDKEIEIIKMNTEKTDSEITLAEHRLEAAMQELEKVKASEAAALDKLKAISERATKTIASSAQHSSVIRISRFEYEYLIGHAEGAQKIADKKVAAAQAWVEALKASEKEMLMKTEMAQREIRELEIVEGKELSRMENSLTLEKALETELSKSRRQEREASVTSLQLVATPRKSLRENGNPAPLRRSRTRRRSLANGTHQFPRSPSITLKKRKVMPSLVKFLRGRRSGKHKLQESSQED